MLSLHRVRLLLKSGVLCLLGLLLVVETGVGQSVTLPLTLDYNLLTSLLVQSSFTDAERSTSVVGSPGECLHVKLSEPQFSNRDELLRLEMKLFIRVGTELGGKCLMPVEWQGYLELFQEPQLGVSDRSGKDTDFVLSFKTVDSNVLTDDRKPAKIAGFLWKFAKPEVYAYLDRVGIDLAPPLSELRSFLAPLFHEEVKEATTAMLDSLHGAGVSVESDHVRVELLTEVEEIYDPASSLDENRVTEEERRQLLELWETWDAFLVHLITTLAAKPLQPADQQVLVDVLLETRYALVLALEQPSMEVDLVRVQFLNAWKRLAPVFRRQLYSEPSGDSLGFLAFFTAADALLVFDTMGPTLGIEISQQGFLRLARMLSGATTNLPYKLELDGRLREIFQFSPMEEGAEPSLEMEGIDLPEEENEDDVLPLSTVFDFFSTPLYAAESGKIPTFAEILQWKVSKKNYPEYLARVRKVLDQATETVLAEQRLPEHLHDIFTTLIPAMAWQESCFRQFVVKKKKFTYLLSYNNSSVGLMQINERVWRGLYDRNRLRWDISYNARAGCEIVDLYLRRYVLRKDPWDNPAKNTLLARVLYSMYNGGPGQYKKFLVRESTGKHFQSDRLFSEKLQWAQGNEWGEVKRCFIGG